jgi:hypothetical protein
VYGVCFGGRRRAACGSIRSACGSFVMSRRQRERERGRGVSGVRASTEGHTLDGSLQLITLAARAPAPSARGGDCLQKARVRSRNAAPAKACVGRRGSRGLARCVCVFCRKRRHGAAARRHPHEATHATSRNQSSRLHAARVPSRLRRHGVVPKESEESCSSSQSLSREGRQNTQPTAPLAIASARSTAAHACNRRSPWPSQRSPVPRGL